MATRNLVDAMILGLDRGIIDLCGGVWGVVGTIGSHVPGNHQTQL